MTFVSRSQAVRIEPSPSENCSLVYPGSLLERERERDSDMMSTGKRFFGLLSSPLLFFSLLLLLLLLFLHAKNSQ